MWVQMLLPLSEIRKQEDGTFTHSVGNSLQKVLTLFPTRRLTLEKTPMTTVTVGKDSIIK